MHTFGGKTQQQARGKRLVGLWRDLLLSFSTVFEQDPENLLALRAFYHQIHHSFKENALRNGAYLIVCSKCGY
jgi:hypothetical protein